MGSQPYSSNMKTYSIILLTCLLSACASTPKEETFNYVSHETLGADFVIEKNKVCAHFEKTTEPMVLRKKFLSSFYENGKEVKKLAQLEVAKNHVAGWHCGETAWAISQNLSSEPALAREVPLN